MVMVKVILLSLHIIKQPELVKVMVMFFFENQTRYLTMIVRLSLKFFHVFYHLFDDSPWILKVVDGSRTVSNVLNAFLMDFKSAPQSTQVAWKMSPREIQKRIEPSQAWVNKRGDRGYMVCLVCGKFCILSRFPMVYNWNKELINKSTNA